MNLLPGPGNASRSFFILYFIFLLVIPYSIIKRIEMIFLYILGQFGTSDLTLSVELPGICPIQFDNWIKGDFAGKSARNLKLGFFIFILIIGCQIMDVSILFMRFFLLI